MGRRENMDSSYSGSWRYEQVNPEDISQSLFLKALQTHGTAIKSCRPSLCSWDANLALAASGNVGASEHQPLDATPTRLCARTQTAPHLWPDLCLFCASTALASQYHKDLQAGQMLSRRDSAAHFGDAPSRRRETSPLPALEGHKVKCNMDGFPTTLCKRPSRRQLLPPCSQPQHCPSSPQEGQATVKFCSSLPT